MVYFESAIYDMMSLDEKVDLLEKIVRAYVTDIEISINMDNKELALQNLLAEAKMRLSIFCDHPLVTMETTPPECMHCGAVVFPPPKLLPPEPEKDS